MENIRRDEWLEQAMEKWEVSLIRVCYAYLGDSSLAEDAVQETFLKAWKGFDAFRGASQEKTWLMRIAINTCKDVRRSAYFRHIDRKTSLDELPEGVYPFAMEDDTLTRSIMALKPPLMEAVLLCWYQELTAEDRVLDMPDPIWSEYRTAIYRPFVADADGRLENTLRMDRYGLTDDLLGMEIGFSGSGKAEVPDGFTLYLMHQDDMSGEWRYEDVLEKAISIELKAE